MSKKLKYNSSSCRKQHMLILMWYQYWCCILSAHVIKNIYIYIYIVFAYLVCGTFWRNLRKPYEISSHHDDIYRYLTFPPLCSAFSERYLGEKRWKNMWEFFYKWVLILFSKFECKVCSIPSPKICIGGRDWRTKKKNINLTFQWNRQQTTGCCFRATRREEKIPAGHQWGRNTILSGIIFFLMKIWKN